MDSNPTSTWDRADPDRLHSHASPQETSSFFRLLPLEIRHMIYTEFWRLTCPNLKVHIVKQNQITTRYMEWHFSSSPCLLDDQNGPDTRNDGFEASRLGEDVKLRHAWMRRIECTWSLHWACEEHHDLALSRERPGWSPFLPVLLGCRLMYQEALTSLFTNLTFVFTDLPTAETFLTSHPRSLFRHIELRVRADPAITELYWADAYTTNPYPSSSSSPSCTAAPTPDNNPWHRFCTALASCPSLKSVNIDYDIRDVRSWEQRVFERPFFEPLWKVRVQQGKGDDFILRIPEVEDSAHKERTLRMADQGQDSSSVEQDDEPVELSEGLARARLRDGEETMEGAPFVVVRAARPNYVYVLFERARLAAPAPPLLLGPPTPTATGWWILEDLYED